METVDLAELLRQQLLLTEQPLPTVTYIPISLFIASEAYAVKYYPLWREVNNLPGTVW